MNLNLVELSLCGTLILLCVGVLIRNWFHGPMSVWSPMSLISLLFLYYCALGPLYFVFMGQTEFLGVDFRYIYWKGWGASLLSFIFVGLGYMSYRGKKGYIGQVCSDDLLQKFAIILIGLSFFAMLYWTTFYRATASMFNPFSSDEARGEITQYTTNQFANYLVNFINLSIPAAVLSMLIWLQKRSIYALSALIFVAGFGMAFYLSSGFRFRIVWLTIALMAAYYLWRKKRPNPVLLGGGALLFIAAMGLIGMTRSYWSGLNMERAQGAKFSDYIDRGFNEAGIFVSLCSVVDVVPDKLGYTYWDPIWITITFPLPRALWPNKPHSETMAVLGRSFGANGGEESGQAIVFFGEWYIACGWLGLIGSSFLFGYLCKRLWVWFLQRRDDKLVILIYTVTLGFLYFVFSRGYTPMMVMNFVFGLLPFFLFYGWLRRKAILAAFRRIFLFQKKAIDEEKAQRKRMDELARHSSF